MKAMEATHEGILQKAWTPSALETVHVREIQTANFAWSLETKQLSLGFDVTKETILSQDLNLKSQHLCYSST